MHDAVFNAAVDLAPHERFSKTDKISLKIRRVLFHLRDISPLYPVKKSYISLIKIKLRRRKLTSIPQYLRDD